MQGVLAVWVRDKTRWLRLVPPEDLSRDILDVILSWGVRTQAEGERRTPRHGAWIVPVWGVGHAAEAFNLLTDDGFLRGEAENGEPGDFPRLAVYTHDSAIQEKAPAVLPSAERYGSTADMAYSDTPYRVDKNDGANPWLMVTGFAQAWKSWYYDIPGGTPAGFYDLRPACQNRGAQGQLQYPPPPMQQSEIIPGSSDVGCFRWVENPGWDPEDPYSQRYTIFSYWFSINEVDAPDGCPLPLGSTWDDIDETSLATEVVKHDPQWVRFESLGATWHEDAEALSWMLRKGFQGQSRFRYRYPCTFTTVRKGGSTSDPGRIYQLETKAWMAQGVRALLNASVVYDDAPEGLAAIERAREGDWPSGGGQVEVPEASRTNTLRGCSQGTDRTRKIFLVGYGRADGSFFVLATDWNDDTLDGAHYLAGPSGLLSLPGMYSYADYWTATIREVDGRLWVHLEPAFIR